jgi:phospholipid transport system substrate-binding protein
MKHFKNVILIFFAVCILIPVNNVYASPVQEKLKASIDQILEILRDPSLKGDEFKEKRRDSLSKVIYERFSFAKMSQLSLARYWKQRSDVEKKIFIELFGQLLEDIYVSKIETYTDEKIVYVKEFVKKKKAQINTKIITASVEIPIDYRMYQTKDGDWMVYDMVIEGVSLVGNYRSQFAQIMQKDTFEKLMEEIKKKLDS